MARRTATVLLDSNFPQFTRLLEDRLEHGMGRGMSRVVSASRSTPTKYRIGPAVLYKIRASSVKHTAKGLAAAVVAPDFRSIFFEKGTNARRRAKVSKQTLRRRESASGQARQARVANAKGVKGVHFLSRGLRLGWAGFLAEIDRALPR